MKSEEIRSRFLAFFEKRGHAIIPSAPLVPLNDPSVLFNTAGMQPLVPYLLGQKHPQGTRIADVQKCVRTGDLDDIGDNRHFSFFEMLGNWSLGAYFKEDAIKYSYDFLTNGDDKPEGDKGLGLDVSRLYFTIFEGDENAPYDQESKDIWMSLGIPEHRIYALGKDNWWSPGPNGPCGPSSEMFYDMTGTTGDLSKEEFIAATDNESVIEIWNDVFMEYEKKDDKVIGKLAQKNVDTGAGLERITAVMQGKQTAYDTDLFEPIMQEIKNIAKDKYNEPNARIVADHIRTAVFMLAEDVTPSKGDRGYVLRRLLRRAVRYADMLGFSEHGQLDKVAFAVMKKYHKDNCYPELFEKNGFIAGEIVKEENRFRETLEKGLREFDKLFRSNSLIISGGKRSGSGGMSFLPLTGEMAFSLYDTFGFPFELSREEAFRRGILESSDIEIIYNQKMAEHQKLSQTASAGMFKGGLANHNEKTIRLHTAHHLLLAALQEVLGKEVKQRGSNITEERLRIDFAFDRKMTDEEKKRVEDIVNARIQEGLNVVRREMPKTEAEKLGAEMEFGVKYPDIVSVYFIEDKNGNHISKEFCGGPHVNNTKELGIFKIQKEEASSAGVRRIKAVLQ